MFTVNCLLLTAMSGHNKWSQIKHRKALTDAKKGKIFSKMARLITITSRAKGKDPQVNPTLRALMDKARSLNMPIDNIERAIAKGAGELEGSQIEEFLLEAYGPAGSAMLIEGATDNRNRSISELKFLLGEHNSKPANPGSVVYLFERIGLITVKISPAKKDELELLAIDAGAQDIKQPDEETMEIYTKPEDLDKIKKSLEENNIKAGDASIIWLAKNEIAVADTKDKERLEKLFEALDEHDDVNEIFSNVNF